MHNPSNNPSNSPNSTNSRPDPRLRPLWDRINRAETHLEKHPAAHAATCGAQRVIETGYSRITAIQAEWRDTPQ